MQGRRTQGWLWRDPTNKRESMTEYDRFARVTMPLAVRDDMLDHAREEAPRECCGLLIGTRDSVARSVRARNLDASAARYLIDPEDHFRAIRDARTEGLEVVGAYHSHPSGEPIPSTTDIAEANSGSDFLYVIVSPVTDEVRAYRIDEERVIRIPLPAA